MKVSLSLSLFAAALLACSKSPPAATPQVQVARPPAQSAPEAAPATAPQGASQVPSTAGEAPSATTAGGAAPMPASAYETGGAGDAAAKKWDRQRKWMDQLKSGGSQRDQAMREINALTSKDRADFVRICKAYGIELK